MKILDRFFKEYVRRFTEELAEMDSIQQGLTGYSSEVYSRLDAAESNMTEACRRLEEQVDPNSEEIEQARVRFRSEIRPWYEQSFLMNRATQKPRGYPGDYEILEGIYNNVSRSTGIGEYLDNLFLNDQLAVAVRSRKDMIREKLWAELEARQGDVSVLNIASGSCREWFELLPLKLEIKLTLICVDFDQMALDHSRKRLEDRARGTEIRFIKENALRLAVRKDNVDRFGKLDISYSFGLYDYLTDKTLKRLLRTQFDLIKPDGKMILTFKDKTRYDGTRHAWFCDWHFVQRSEQGVYDLLAQTGLEKAPIKTTWE
ncbi:MAG: class I SAM-dependent methyltransferase, partial [Proteobacteria bacterium]|nr:class I SAM-dependent methyltransferase [Pseudomonadota bacterium]